MRIINESTAIALAYGYSKKTELSDSKARCVAFVDFGHSALTVTFCSFYTGKTTIIMTHSNRNVGARQIDYILFQTFAQEFFKKHGIDPRENNRCRLRLLDAIEKMRKLLSSNKEAEVNCDSLLDDIDYHRSMKRDELESLLEPFMKDFTYCLQHALAKSGKFFTLILSNHYRPKNQINLIC